MAATTNLEKPTPTDTTVLARYWMLNDDDEALKSAVAAVQFELHERERRAGISEQNKAATAKMQADIHAEIVDIEKIFDVERAGL